MTDEDKKKLLLKMIAQSGKCDCVICQNEKKRLEVEYTKIIDEKKT